MRMKKFNNDEFKFNLQLFADEGNEDVEDTQDEETQEDNKDEKKIDIQAILDNPEFVKYMESHADKRVSNA